MVWRKKNTHIFFLRLLIETRSSRHKCNNSCLSWFFSLFLLLRQGKKPPFCVTQWHDVKHANAYKKNNEIKTEITTIHDNCVTYSKIYIKKRWIVKCQQTDDGTAVRVQKSQNNNYEKLSMQTQFQSVNVYTQFLEMEQKEQMRMWREGTKERHTESKKWRNEGNEGNEGVEDRK